MSPIFVNVITINAHEPGRIPNLKNIIRLFYNYLSPSKLVS